MSNLWAFLGHTGRIVLGHTLDTHTLMKTGEQKKVLSTFMILFWAAFLAVLGHILPVGHELNIPGRALGTGIPMTTQSYSPIPISPGGKDLVNYNITLNA